MSVSTLTEAPHPRRRRPAIAVFGLGYVGAVTAACFAARGHRLIGVDVNADKVKMINDGQSPIIEERIGELVAGVVASGALTATTSAAEAVAATDVALVCVGTPSTAAGGLSTEYLRSVSDEIGAAIAGRSEGYTVAYRSTMLPGTCQQELIPRLEAASGKVAGRDFGVCVNPEFLREGTSVRDFENPPKTVVGELSDACGDVVASLYEGLPGDVFRVPIKVAEMTKYVDNSFHALKVTFANEIGAICKNFEMDSHEVMAIFRADTKLNISAAYLRPGFSFGGSCLPKDVRALTYAARHNDVQAPLLEAILPSNATQTDRVFAMVQATGCRRVGLFGLSFKSGTDDLRESPLVHLAERLLGRGFELRIYDSNVSMSAIHGANRAYIDARIPHLSRLVSPAAAVAEHAQVCVLGTSDPSAVRAVAAVPDAVVIDLVRTPETVALAGTHQYEGVSW